MNTIKIHQSLVATFVGIILLFSGCQQPPDYPKAPLIWQESDLEYVNIKNGFDTVRVHLAFQDGDGNLGLDETDTLSPFHAFTIVRDGSGAAVRIQPGEKFNIYSFADIDVDGNGTIDTVRIKRNLFKDNFLIDFLKINSLGEVEDTLKFENIGTIGADNFNGRFQPLYKKDFSDEEYEGPLEGTITYQFISSFLLIPKGEYRISVRIVDRDLNISNSVLCTPSLLITL